MEGFQLISYDWRYLYVNDAVVKQSKYSREELLGKTMMEKYPGIEKTHMFSVLQRCMQERVSAQLDNEFRFPDGSLGCFELRIHPVPEGLFILSIDISERKKAEAKQSAYINGLEEIIFMTSHRVRQPVAHIMGVSNLLENAAHSQDDLQKIVGYMKESAISLDTLTQQLTTMIHELKTKNK